MYKADFYSNCFNKCSNQQYICTLLWLKQRNKCSAKSCLYATNYISHSDPLRHVFSWVDWSFKGDIWVAVKPNNPHNWTIHINITMYMSIISITFNMLTYFGTLQSNTDSRWLISLILSIKIKVSKWHWSVATYCWDVTTFLSCFSVLGLTYYLEQLCRADLCVSDADSLFLPYIS